jgi:hypothetical protein
MSDSEQSRQLPTPFNVLAMLRRDVQNADKPRREDKDFKRASAESAREFVDQALRRLGVGGGMAASPDAEPAPETETPFRVEPERRAVLMQKLKELGVPDKAIEAKR